MWETWGAEGLCSPHTDQLPHPVGVKQWLDPLLLYCLESTFSIFTSGGVKAPGEGLWLLKDARVICISLLGAAKGLPRWC